VKITSNAKIQQMNGNERTAPESVQPLPEPQVGVAYWVQCRGHRTLAVWTADGKWRAVIGGLEESEVIGFMRNNSGG
jgi:hypothetical protein